MYLHIHTYVCTYVYELPAVVLRNAACEGCAGMVTHKAGRCDCRQLQRSCDRCRAIEKNGN